MYSCVSAGDGGFQVQVGRADRLAGRGIAHGFEIFQMPVRMSGLAFRGRAEYGGDVVVAFDVGLLCEIEVAAIRLALAGESVPEVLGGLAVLEMGHVGLLGAHMRRSMAKMEPPQAGVNSLE